jgi:hypothetical protein
VSNNKIDTKSFCWYWHEFVSNVSAIIITTSRICDISFGLKVVKALLRLVELSLVEFSPHQGFKMDCFLITWKSLMILGLTVARVHDKIYLIPDPFIFYIKIKIYVFAP